MVRNFQNMIDNKKADELVSIAQKQLKAGLKLKEKRFDIIKDVEDLYNNKCLETIDDRVNIPFPIMAGHIDTLYSKIDNPPTVTFKFTDLPNFGEKISSAWKADSSSMRARWTAKDRTEKKMSLLSGRGIAKVYASSVNNQYQSNYDVVDYWSFICEGRRGYLEDNLYAGEMDIYKTKEEIEQLAEQGVYDKAQVKKLLDSQDNARIDEYSLEIQNKYNRMKSLGLMPESNAFVGQSVYNLVEWVMQHGGKRYYLVFDIKSGLWLRAELLKDLYACNLYPWVSWAVNYEEYNFWSKGAGDDILPVSEAIKLILNEVIENTRRRNRPMRVVDPELFDDVSDIMDYVPDNVVVATQQNAGQKIFTIETPEVSTSVNVIQFLENYLGQKTGITPTIQGATDTDAKVGVYYGQLEQSADRIGTINKEYSDSYAQKGYRYFWGLKEHLTESKAIQMLGKGGIHSDELTRKELKDVVDVDDVVVSGGSSEEQINEVRTQRQARTIAELSANPALSSKISPKWLIEITLKTAGFTEDEVNRAMDIENEGNSQLIKEADESIKMILLNKNVKLNRGANTAFIQHILNYEADNLDFEMLDKAGKVVKIDKKKAELSQKLRDYAKAHIELALQNSVRNVRQIIAKEGGALGEYIQSSNEQLNIPVSSEREKMESVARPFENNSTPKGVSSTSQNISNILSGQR